MAKVLRRSTVAAFLLSIFYLVPRAQMRVVPIDQERGHVALGLALRHLANTGIFMMATAHPDDENNGLLVELSRGQGYRTTLATATRGNGGQNEIGPELLEPLAVLRTEELTALHRFDGVEQYFTRAVDFGYTIDIDENLKQWGRDEIIGDYVRLIRTIRPDVISAQSPTAIGPGQHANHALAAILSHDAYLAAADAAKYPEQIKDGLRPWQPKKFYYAAGGPGGGGQAANAARTCRVDLSLYDSLLGRTYSEIGSEARSMHKCQGMAQLLALPGPSNTALQLAETTIAGEMNKDERGLFDGVDTSIAGLAQFAGARAPRDLSEGLNQIASNVQTAQKRFDSDAGDQAALQPILAGLRIARALRSQLRTMQMDANGRDEIDFRLRQKEREFQQAALDAAGIEVEALSDDGLVVPGQSIRVNVIVANHGSADVNVGQIRFDGFAATAPCALDLATAAGGRGGAPGGRGGRGAAPAQNATPVSALRAGQVGRCTATLTVPQNAHITEPYWHRVDGSGRYVFDADAPFGLPFRPTQFYVDATLSFGSDEVIDGLPVQYRYEGAMLSGEKRGELLVVPAMSVRVSPSIALVPLGLGGTPAPAPTPTAARGGRAAAPAPAPAAPAQAGRGRGTAAPAARPAPAGPEREIRVTVVNDTKAAADATVTLQLPEGWTAAPPAQDVKFSREDESRTVRFAVRAAAGARPGDYHVKAIVTYGDANYDRGYQVIEYPHIRRAHIYEAADVTFKVLEVRTAPNLTVGYVMGTGDEVPGFIEQLGAKVDMLDQDALAWGDLSKYKTIVLGVRAYERRDDLRANNTRLLEYVENGGTLIVQYNRNVSVREIPGPYPAQVSDARVTDEDAPVRILLPDHPVFNTPNKITDAAWSGWVQERGLNFLGDKDSRYRDLLQLTDTFANNPGEKKGALVEATYGKGRWLYVGLGLWRELPAGVNGSYQLLANLISLGATR